MATLYIDVYFLINFTVDLLSVFFAAKLTKVNTKITSIVVAATAGGLQAVIYVLFFDRYIYGIIFSLLYFSFLALYISKGIAIQRKLKFTIAFCFIQILIGGSVYYLYEAMNRYFDLDVESIGAENRRLLILSLIILLSIGIIRLSIGILTSSKSERVARILILYSGKETELDCLVDTGNLALDPIDKTPVLFLTKNKFKAIFGTDSLPTPTLNSSLRVIPVKNKKNTEIYYGIKHDEVYLLNKKRKEKIKLILALGNEEKYGAFDALLPFSVVSR